MRKTTRFTLITVVVVVVVLVAAVFAVYRAAQQAPEFYREALDVPRPAQVEESDRMITQITTLQNELQSKGHWREVFKAQTINGWLAVDLPQNHPTLLPAWLHDPRVHISPEGITIACQVDRDGFHTVVSLQVSALVQSEDVVELRIHKARLGAIPWSFDSALDKLIDSARKSGVEIRREKVDGDPAALIKVPSVRGDGKQVIHIDTIRLEEGAVIVAGTTEIAR